MSTDRGAPPRSHAPSHVRLDLEAVEARFQALLRGRRELRAGDVLVVALSGGLDSVVLLHLLRFGAPQGGIELRAAHFDHAMRASSARDARWVAGLCRAWDVELHARRAEVAPTSEEEARTARYAFLEQVRGRLGARLVLTAHHADDQAETVLFRALRGTGRLGLAGIPARREPAVWRPLLGFWREELEGYARTARLSWLDDPTNEEPRYARNALRRRILPQIERLVAPGARRALVRLADLASEDEAGWESILPVLIAPLGVTTEAHGISFDRTTLVGLHPAVQARILRALAATAGTRLGGGATALAVDFARTAASGRRLDLSGAWSLHRELDRLAFRSDRVVPPDAPLRILDAGPGSGDALLGGERVPVVWGAVEGSTEPSGHSAQAEIFDSETLRFPLTVRAREPGDRIRLPGGTKKVKKLLLERRISVARRNRIPLVVDAVGDVLWIPDVARGEAASAHRSAGALRIGIG